MIIDNNDKILKFDDEVYNNIKKLLKEGHYVDSALISNLLDKYSFGKADKEKFYADFNNTTKNFTSNVNKLLDNFKNAVDSYEFMKKQNSLNISRHNSIFSKKLELDKKIEKLQNKISLLESKQDIKNTVKLENDIEEYKNKLKDLDKYKNDYEKLKQNDNDNLKTIESKNKEIENFKKLNEKINKQLDEITKINDNYNSSIEHYKRENLKLSSDLNECTNKLNNIHWNH